MLADDTWRRERLSTRAIDSRPGTECTRALASMLGTTPADASSFGSDAIVPPRPKMTTRFVESGFIAESMGAMLVLIETATRFARHMNSCGPSRQRWSASPAVAGRSNFQENRQHLSSLAIFVASVHCPSTILSREKRDQIDADGQSDT